MSRMRLAFCASCAAEVPVVMQPVVLASGRVSTRRERRCLKGHRVSLRHSRHGTAKPTMGTTGRMRPGSGEAGREADLKWLEQAGKIRDLRLCNDPPKQTYRLDVYGTREVEALLEWIEREVPQGWSMRGLDGLVRDLRRSREHLQSYTPDFTYREAPDWRYVVEDYKPSPPPGWSKIATLMRVCHGIDVKLTGGPKR